MLADGDITGINNTEIADQGLGVTNPMLADGDKVNDTSIHVTTTPPSVDKMTLGGKKKKYNLNFQKGGTQRRAINENQQYCYNKIQSYVLNVFSKCNKFLLDTFNNVMSKPVASGNTVNYNSLAQLLKVHKGENNINDVSVFKAIHDTNNIILNQEPLFIYLDEYIKNNIIPYLHWQTIPDVKILYIKILYYLAKYSDINGFFTYLLFNVGENAEDNGLYIQIQELSLEYTEDMLMLNGVNNKQLTMSEFLIILKLPYVRNLIMMLSIQISDESGLPDGTQYNSIFKDVYGAELRQKGVGGGKRGIEEVDPTPVSNNRYVVDFNISFLPVAYKTLIQPYISFNSVLLLTLGIMNVIYEGRSAATKFNNTAFDAIWELIYNRDGALRDSIDFFARRESAKAFFGVTSAIPVSTIQDYIMRIVMEVTYVNIIDTSPQTRRLKAGKKIRSKKTKKKKIKKKKRKTNKRKIKKKSISKNKTRNKKKKGKKYSIKHK